MAVRQVTKALHSAAHDRSKWPFLDGARGVAMIAVFGFHAIRIVGEWYSPKIRGEGIPEYLWAAGLTRFAIDVFFVLSGFLIATTWRARRKRHDRLRPALGEYVRGRALRVLPVFWVSIAVLVPLRAPELLTSAKDVLLLVTSQQYLDPDLPGQFNVVTWSLTTEIHFYVLLPVLAVLIGRRFGSLPALTGTVALTVWWYGARGDWPSSVILGRLDQFVVGMIVAEVYRRWSEGEPSRLVGAVTARGMGWILGAALVAIGVYHGTTFGLPRGHFFDAWQHPLAGIAIGGLGLRMLCAPAPGHLRRFLERPTFLLLGAMSYSLYLWHLPILDSAFDLLAPFNDGVPVVGNALALALAAALSFAVAALSYTFVELPFMRRKPKSSKPVTKPVPSRENAAASAAGAR